MGTNSDDKKAAAKAAKAERKAAKAARKAKKLAQRNKTASDSAIETSAWESIDFEKIYKFEKVEHKVEVSFKDLSLFVDVTEKTASQRLKRENVPIMEKQILSSMTGVIRPGTLTAVMGASGAGKSSFLNTLAGKVQGRIEGELLFNGLSRKEADFSETYVMQDDVFFATQTVAEILELAALFRVPGIDGARAKERTNTLLKSLDIEKTRDTQVGMPGVRRGVSGGERKRVAVGVGLIANPSVIFCDEPTSGLDTGTAENVMYILRALASVGHTVVTTIHQPNSDIWSLFDQFMLLSDGKICYYGPARAAVPYFATLGYKCPRYVNPADFLVKLLTKDPRDETKEDKKQAILDAYERTSTTKESENARELSMHDMATKKREKVERGYAQGFVRQVSLLMGREYKNNLRNEEKSTVRLGQTIFLSLLIAFIYFQIGDNQTNVRDRYGVLFFVLINQSFGALMSLVTTFPDERSVFYRERADNMYSPMAFFTSKICSDLPPMILNSLLGSALMYWIIGLNPEFESFVVFCAVNLLCSDINTAVGFMIGILTPDVSIGVALAPVSIIPWMLFSGFLINTESVNVVFKIVEWLSYFRYGFENLIIAEFKGVDSFECPPEPEPCRYPNGQAAIDDLGFDADNTARNFLFIFLIDVVMHTFCYLAFRSKTKKAKTIAA